MEAGRHYEFDTAQNDLIAVLARRMKWVAWFLMIFSVIMAMGGIAGLGEGGAGAIVQAVLMFVIALWTRKAAAAFESIVQTEGADIANLMDALGELRKLYTLQYWVIIVGIVLVVIALLVGLGVLAFGGGS